MDRLAERNRGFTLIELLVVISIISLLTTILLPSLGRARQMGKSVVCLANLRRLATANAFYVTDYGRFPPVRMTYRPDGSSYVNNFGRIAPRWHWFLSEGAGPVIDPTPYGGAPFGDSQTTTITNDYFLCPSTADEFARDERNGPYGYNYQYLGDSRSVTGGRYTNFPVAESAAPNTGSTILFGDSRGGGNPHGKHSYTLDPPKLAASRGVTKFGPNGSTDGPIAHSPVEHRHLGKGNVSFLDAHAESRTLEELGYQTDSDGNALIGGAGSSNRYWTGTGQDEP